MPTPWTFGWTQLLTIVGFIITVSIAAGGFRTFARWEREKIAEKRIDTAIEALALVYETKFIFDHIRSEASFPYEWKDMPDGYGSETERNARAPFYAILKRIEGHKEFFERVWKIQVRCTALFGPKVEEVFFLMHRARREIEVSAEMLFHEPRPSVETPANLDTWNRFRADVWLMYESRAKGGDRVGQKLTEFREKMEGLCRPIIDHEYRTGPRRSIIGRVGDWFGR
jgi:hypothetical protein